VQPNLLLEFVVAALAAGKIARTADHNFISNHDTLRVVNRFAVSASARLFPSVKSGHRRSLSRKDG
jgi:hypothetical protein